METTEEDKEEMEETVASELGAIIKLKEQKTARFCFFPNFLALFGYIGCPPSRHWEARFLITRTATGHLAEIFPDLRL